MAHSNKLTLFFILSLLLPCKYASADEVDFYEFRTKYNYNPKAAKEKDFSVVIKKSNRYEPKTSQEETIYCKAHANQPSEAICQLKHFRLALRNDAASALSLLGAKHGIQKDSVSELQRLEDGFFQVQLKNNDIYHVKIEIPEFIATPKDDSMECQISAVFRKSIATIRCRSRFDSNKNFEVKDVPVVKRAAYNSLIFVSLGKTEAECKINNKKIKDLVSGISRLKNIGPVDANAFLIQAGDWEDGLWAYQLPSWVGLAKVGKFELSTFESPTPFEITIDPLYKNFISKNIRHKHSGIEDWKETSADIFAFNDRFEHDQKGPRSLNDISDDLCKDASAPSPGPAASEQEENKPIKAQDTASAAVKNPAAKKVE